ncbi:hypothetical protein PVIIG_01573 [Plasmodium vivax India VII]|uniref:Uncharacterized protein n=4 Tax=Plasmodium vivax TaxID=5855 RepID=A5K922_PLAVS|nr:hypothetical protein, conserved [Plasmodium vivax]KMZ77604.1 hypothetical protein PVIIG_01573 [Plasmodium vivax India VII]KMZ84763.1 hypothetical protein PVBG_00543 [Plasmodium vivax Brazil I]KMZ90043.1 hypothetical protein PVMG_03604 [Plasmodium vivax Mauritania I]EDL44318.1 hypothetical protein, conserved [Plasmodium vivax]CAI7723856.1 conserved Plasmodium protein, unknown function [Plasmodium vivax]|eukprot:XP_001614045.1 hypothetical protein [Plasmodium vivax Sal-1]
MSDPSNYDPKIAATLYDTFGDYMAKPTVVGECSCSYALNVFLGLLLFNVMLYLSYIVGKKEIFQKLKYHGYY